MWNDDWILASAGICSPSGEGFAPVPADARFAIIGVV
jgi:hypothetical protein